VSAVVAASVGLLSALAGALVLTPRLRRLALDASFLDEPAAHKSHHVPVPYLGGLAITAAALVGVGVAAIAGFSHRSPIAAILIGAIAVAVLGAFDDDRGLRADVRLLAQTAAATAVVLAGVEFTVTGTTLFDAPLTILWIVAITNAINFLDNMDGLSSGLAVVGGLSVAIIAGGHLPGIAVLGAVLAGACLGFLPFNRPPAQIYMGDTGSLFIGFLLAATTVEVASSFASPRSTLVPLMLLAVPLLDLCTVCIGRLRRGIPVTIGGLNHLSHRLVARGLSRGAAVCVLVACSAITGLVAVLVARFSLSTMTALAITGVVLVGLTAATVRVPVFPDDVRPRFPRRLLLLAGALVVVVTLVAAPAAVSLARARHDLEAAATATRAGVEAQDAGQSDVALARFSEATRYADAARDELGGRFTSMGLAIPVVRTNIIESRQIASAAELLATGLANGQSGDDASAGALRALGGDDRLVLPFVNNAKSTIRQASVQVRDNPLPATADPAPAGDLPIALTVFVAFALLAAGAGVVLTGRLASVGRRGIMVGDSEVGVILLTDLLVDAEATQ
jgi:UDP-GlcNAc:undecaprenyl-phosphate GlcNAc-1-phosphate transferase